MDMIYNHNRISQLLPRGDGITYNCNFIYSLNMALTIFEMDLRWNKILSAISRISIIMQRLMRS